MCQLRPSLSLIHKQDEDNAAWQAKLDNLRAIGMQTAVWVPFKAEVKLGTFKDKYTNLTIRPPKHIREFEHYKEPGPGTNLHTPFNHTYKYEDLASKRTGTAGSYKRI